MGLEQNKILPSQNLEKEPGMLGRLSSGEKVFDRPNSHIHEIDPEIVQEALGKINAAHRDFIVEGVDFGRTIGKSQCIETDESDDIVYAQREGRHGLSRFVMNKEREDTSIVTVILKEVSEGYIVITVFAGPSAEREPWDRNIVSIEERDRSAAFWRTHALVWDGKNIVPGTGQAR